MQQSLSCNNDSDLIAMGYGYATKDPFVKIVIASDEEIEK
jgi:hypothetical protein